MDPSSWYEAPTQQYYPYAHFPNPGAVSSCDAPAPVPAPASSLVYEAHSAAGAVGPPGVDAHAPNAYGTHGGYGGHAVSYVYPTAGAASYYPGFGGGDAQGLSVKNGNRQYVVHPVAQGNVLGKPPGLSVRQNKAAHPFQNGTTRKIKKKIPKIVQSAYCEVCKIVCNSQDVLNNHRQGKKHKKNLEKLKESITPNPVTTLAGKKETPGDKKDKTEPAKTKKNAAPVSEKDLETKMQKVLEGGAAETAVKVCTLCNVVCNSPIVFSYHMAGQKHAAMVKKQQGASVSQT